MPKRKEAGGYRLAIVPEGEIKRKPWTVIRRSVMDDGHKGPRRGRGRGRVEGEGAGGGG